MKRVTNTDLRLAHQEAQARDRWFTGQNRAMAETFKHYWRRTMLDALEISRQRKIRRMWDGEVSA